MIGGTVPSQIGQLSKLTRLVIDENSLLSGPLPEELYNCTDMQVLNFGDSNIGGTISTKVGRLRKLLLFLAMRTSISGRIPSQVGRLGKMSILGIGSKKLSGSTPSEIGNARNLWELHLSNNDYQETSSFSSRDTSHGK